MAEEDLDEEQQELAKLKCASLSTEEVVDRQRAKQEREERRREMRGGGGGGRNVVSDGRRMAADYPGLAFGSAGMFGGSDTMMKFSVIKNELHNIMRSQLRRVDGEVAAMAERVKRLDENLEKSERHIREATAALSEAVAFQVESASSAADHKEEEGQDALSMFDAQLRLLEAKMEEAR